MSRRVLLHEWLIAATAALVAIFAWRQNHGATVGGAISVPKACWLAATLIVFFVVPGAWWRNANYSRGVRALFGIVFLGFVARGAVEMWLLYAVRGWQCAYGIAHDLATAAVVALGWWLCRGGPPADRRALRFAPVLLGMLLAEAWMAWSFSRLASPADGIYFAANTPHFQQVNDLTRLVLFIAAPALAWALRSARQDF